MRTTQRSGAPPTTPTVDCCGPVRLWGWSPSALPADTRAKQRIDRVFPRTGLPAVLYFAAVIVLLNVGRVLPPRGNLVVVGVAGVAAGGWCALNFWRCRHAHCVVTGAGWLGLGLFTLAEAGIGRSVIGGDEGAAFVAILAAGLLFECLWRAARGTNAVV